MWETDFGHSSVFRGYKGQSPLGGYSSMGLSVGDKSLGHYLKVGCFSEEGLLYCSYFIS